MNAIKLFKTPKTSVVFDCVTTEPNHLNRALALGFDRITQEAYEGVVEVDNNGVITRVLAYLTIPYHFDLTDEPHAQFRADFVTKVRQELETYKETA